MRPDTVQELPSMNRCDKRYRHTVCLNQRGRGVSISSILPLLCPRIYLSAPIYTQQHSFLTALGKMDSKMKQAQALRIAVVSSIPRIPSYFVHSCRVADVQSQWIHCGVRPSQLFDINPKTRHMIVRGPNLLHFADSRPLR